MVFAWTNSCFYWGKVWQVKWLGTWKVSQTCHGKQVRLGWAAPETCKSPRKCPKFWICCFKWCQMFSWLSLAFSKTSKTSIGWDLAKYIKFIMFFCGWCTVVCILQVQSTAQYRACNPAVNRLFASCSANLPSSSTFSCGLPRISDKMHVNLRKTEKRGLYIYIYCFFRIFWRCFFCFYLTSRFVEAWTPWSAFKCLQTLGASNASAWRRLGRGWSSAVGLDEMRYFWVGWDHRWKKNWGIQIWHVI